jgi:hypothetical protein
VSAFIDEHRARFGVEPICRTLGVSASACYQRASEAPLIREHTGHAVQPGLYALELLDGAGQYVPSSTSQQGGSQ